jgi:hypothetical protein
MVVPRFLVLRRLREGPARLCGAHTVPKIRVLRVKDVCDDVHEVCSACLLEYILFYYQIFHQSPVSLAQLGERQTEVSVAKSGGIAFDPRRGHQPRA